MAVSKVILNGTTLMDLTQDTVTAATLLQNETAHKNDGTGVTGALVPSGDWEDITEDFDIDNVGDGTRFTVLFNRNELAVCGSGWCAVDDFAAPVVISYNGLDEDVVGAIANLLYLIVVTDDLRCDCILFPDSCVVEVTPEGNFFFGFAYGSEQ